MVMSEFAEVRSGRRARRPVNLNATVTWALSPGGIRDWSRIDCNAVRGSTGNAQSDRFGSTGEDFTPAQRSQ